MLLLIQWMKLVMSLIGLYIIQLGFKQTVENVYESTEERIFLK